MPKDVILTPDGLEKLKDELELLSTERRREVAARIKEAREFGDISENSEYNDAKNEQAMLETRIAQLEEKLRMATVIEVGEISTDVVQVGSVVHVKDEKTGKSVKYTIVGSAEANPEENKLSNESPVGPCAARAQAQRDGRGAGPARPCAQAQDHEDRRRPQRRIGAACAIRSRGHERGRRARCAAKRGRRVPPRGADRGAQGEGEALGGRERRGPSLPLPRRDPGGTLARGVLAAATGRGDDRLAARRGKARGTARTGRRGVHGPRRPHGADPALCATGRARR